MRISAIVALQTINSLEVPFRRRNTRYPFPLTKYYCTVYRLDRDQLCPKSRLIILAFEKKKSTYTEAPLFHFSPNFLYPFYTLERRRDLKNLSSTSGGIPPSLVPQFL